MASRVLIRVRVSYLWHWCIWTAPSAEPPGGRDRAPPGGSALCSGLRLEGTPSASAGHSSVCQSTAAPAGHCGNYRIDFYKESYYWLQSSIKNTWNASCSFILSWITGLNTEIQQLFMACLILPMRKTAPYPDKTNQNVTDQTQFEDGWMNAIPFLFAVRLAIFSNLLSK